MIFGKLLSDHEVQSKSRILGGLDSNVSTNEIISGKQINIQNKDNSLILYNLPVKVLIF